jgi:phosphomannomutase/phosphoglucomutase
MTLWYRGFVCKIVFILHFKQMIKSIFKAYDIRGIVNSELTPQTIELIGKALGTYSISCGEKEFVIGRDGRLSGTWIRDSLIKGITSTGCFVVDIGMVPTPLVYFATKTTTAKSGVMITGSHNPPNYNGLKIVIAGKTLSGDAITNLYDIIQSDDFKVGSGLKTSANIEDEYLKKITDDIKIGKKLKIVVDCGNGVAGELAPKLYKNLDIEVIEMFCEIDGNFPNHHPDPSKPENLADLINKVKETNADMGFAFDGDGDRLGLIDNLGNVIWADRQMMLYAQDILSRKQNSKIIFDVKCSSNLPNHIKKCGGNPIMSRTGHSFIKAKIIEEQAELGGEMSGHIFFKERWFGFDDALYTGARLLEIISNQDNSVAEVFDNLPNSVNTPELNIHFENQGEQFVAMDKLSKNISFDGEISTIDGVRVDWDYGWGLVRPSNTTPCLVLRFEADNQANLDKIKNKFKTFLSSQDVDNNI